MPITAADLTRYKAFNDRYLPSACTIAHGGGTITTICRVDTDRQPLRAEGLPRFVAARRWQIVLRDGIAVSPGDRITVTGKGIYQVLDVADPVDYSFNTIAYSYLLPESVSGHVPGTLPFPTNAVVDFVTQGDRIHGPDKILGAHVVIYEDPATVRLQENAVEVPYAVAFAPDLTYPVTGQHVKAGDTIRWDERRAGYEETLDKPRLIPGPPTFMRAYFHETN